MINKITNSKYWSLFLFVILAITMEFVENSIEIENNLIQLAFSSTLYLIIIAVALNFKFTLPIKNTKIPFSVRLVVFTFCLILGLNLIFQWFFTLLVPFVLHPEYVDVMNYHITFEQVIGSIIIYPILEELLFRRIIAAEIKNKFGFTIALLVSSTLFAYCHYNTETNISLAFSFGLILGYIYLKTNNFWLVVLAHASSNFIVLFFSSWFQNKLIDYSLETMNSNNFNGFLFWSFIGCLSLLILMLYGLRKHVKKLNYNKKTQSFTTGS